MATCRVSVRRGTELQELQSLVVWISRLLEFSSRSSHATAPSWEAAGPLAAEARVISPTQRERQGDQHFPLLRYRWLLRVQSELQTL
eukprot:scaffold5808_cov128-Isochrysis_galbana.AAC.29